MSKISVEKTKRIAKPAKDVFALVNDLRKWKFWSPWLVMEPDCPVTYEADGKAHTWQGEFIGQGEIKIVAEQFPTAIDIQVEFLKPYKNSSDVRFEFRDDGAHTEVSWTMNSSLPMFLFWMKKTLTNLIGMDYERGLSMLKEYAETGSVPSKLDFLGVVPQEQFRYVGIKTQCPLADVGERMGADFKRLEELMSERKLTPASPPISIYHDWNLDKKQVDYTAGMPLNELPDDLPDGVIAGEVPECSVYAIRHTGAYHLLGNAWSAGISRQRAKLFGENKAIAPFEVYESDPRETKEKDCVTIVKMPVA